MKISCVLPACCHHLESTAQLHPGMGSESTGLMDGFLERWQVLPIYGRCGLFPGPTRPPGKLEGGSLVLKFGDEAPAGRNELLDIYMLFGWSPAPFQCGSPYVRACQEANGQDVSSAF